MTNPDPALWMKALYVITLPGTGEWLLGVKEGEEFRPLEKPELEQLARHHAAAQQPQSEKRGASTIVRELELELECLQKRVDDVGMLVCTVGPKDPRSGPFIAKRVRELLGMKLVLVDEKP